MPGNHVLRFGVNLTHQLYLLVALWSRLLIYADLIDPDVLDIIARSVVGKMIPSAPMPVFEGPKACRYRSKKV